MANSSIGLITVAAAEASFTIPANCNALFLHAGTGNSADVQIAVASAGAHILLGANEKMTIDDKDFLRADAKLWIDGTENDTIRYWAFVSQNP